eukprot:6907256-Prymnesium_polylepis.1
MQKVMMLLLLGAEDIEKLTFGCCCGRVEQGELHMSLRVRVTANRGLSSACAGMLRARGQWSVF